MKIFWFCMMILWAALLVAGIMKDCGLIKTRCSICNLDKPINAVQTVHSRNGIEFKACNDCICDAFMDRLFNKPSEEKGAVEDGNKGQDTIPQE